MTTNEKDSKLSPISGVTYLVNPTKNEYNAFLLQHKELRIFQDNRSNFYVYSAKDATHFAFEKELGLTHKIGTNLGITKQNKVHPELGMMLHLAELKKTLSPELYKKNIGSLSIFLTWLKVNFNVDISNAKSKKIIKEATS